jgi:hypothetical protein
VKISIQVKSIIIALVFTGLGWQGSTQYHELKTAADKQELKELGFSDAGKPIPRPLVMSQFIDEGK